MKLNSNDYGDLSAVGPQGLTEDQQDALIKAVESIKGRAFQDGRNARTSETYFLRTTRKDAT